jgi:hypothetical protein
MSRQALNSNSYNDDLVYYNTNGRRQRMSGDYSNSYAQNQSPYNSRRRSRDYTLDTMRSRNEEVRNGLFREVEVFTISSGTRLNLWDPKTEKITDAHFVNTGDLQVLIRRGHGSMFNLLKQIAYPEDVHGKRNSGDFSQLWNETKEAFKSIPLVKDVMSDKGRFQDALSMVLNSQAGRIDAILMAYTPGENGKIGLYFVDEGVRIDPSIFSQ